MNRLLHYSLILFCLLLLEQTATTAQPVAHTCQRQVNQLLQQDGCLFGATTGGLFILDTLTGAFDRFTVLEGMSENDSRQLAITGDGLLWSAVAGAGLDLFALTGTGGQPQGLELLGTFQEFAADDQIFSIHDLAVQGEWVFVATDIGFTRMRWDVSSGGFTVDYTVRRAGELGYEVPINRIGSFNDSIVLATTCGVALHDPTLGEPDQPESWQVYPICGSDDEIRQLVSSGSEVWLLVADVNQVGHLYRIDSDGPVEVLSHLNLLDVTLRDSTLLLADQNRIYSFSGESGDPLVELALVTNFNRFADNGRGSWYHRRSTWTDAGGLVQFNSNQETVIPGPAMESFTDLEYDATGRLWVTGQSAGAVGAGIALWQGEEWINYTCQDSSYRAQMRLSTGFEAFNELLIDSEGWIWLSTWGYGLIMFRPDLERFYRFDEESAPGQRLYGPVTENGPLPNYPITAGLSEDPQGNIWVLNNRTLNDSVLVVIPAEIHISDSTSFHYLALPETNLYSLYAEQNGNIWAGAGAILSGAGGAGDWGSSSKDIYGLLEYDSTPPVWEQDSLQVTEISLAEEEYNGGISGSSGFITTMRSDLDGNFWVATTEGLYYSSVFLGDPTLFNRLLYVQGLSSETVYCLAVDPRNRLWVGTDDGLDLLDVSTFLFTEHYTEAVTGIPWSNVRALDFNPLDGVAAVVTGRGIFIMPTGLAEHPEAQPDVVHPYPNPFRPGQHDRLRFPPEEVSRYSTAAVYTPSGKLVRRFSGVQIDQGWDGRAENAELVPSGIYVILLSGSQGKATGKIAVIR